LSPNSRRLIRATLSVLFGDAVAAGDAGITSNPVIGIARKGRKQLGTLAPAERQIRPMTYQQLAVCLRAARQHCSPRDALLLLTLADTGLRPSEALALQWPDVDTTGRTITVERAVTLRGRIKPTKTEKSRPVDLSSRLAEALAGWQAAGEAEALAKGTETPSIYIFPSRTGKPLEAPTIAREFQALLRRAGLPRFRLYDLRHTYATQLLVENAPLTYVAAQLGHAKPTTTLAFYAHWLPRGDKTYIDRLTLAREAAAAKTPRLGVSR